IAPSNLNIAASQQHVGLDNTIVPARIAEKRVRLQQPVAIPEDSLSRHDLRQAQSALGLLTNLECAFLIRKIAWRCAWAIAFKVLHERKRECLSFRRRAMSAFLLSGSTGESVDRVGLEFDFDGFVPQLQRRLFDKLFCRR